jgi:uncharacterized protein GlcG (DUF336 family)
MSLLGKLFGGKKRRPTRRSSTDRHRAVPRLEVLEDRSMPSATGVLAAGTLTINGTPNAINFLNLSIVNGDIVLLDNGVQQASFSSAAVNNIVVNANGLFNIVHVSPDIAIPAVLNGGPRGNFLFAGSGPTVLNAGPAFNGFDSINRLVGGAGDDMINGNIGHNVMGGGLGTNLLNGGNSIFLGNSAHDIIGAFTPGTDFNLEAPTADPPNLSQTLGLPPTPNLVADQLTTSEVQNLLDRASAATASADGIVVITDRGGRILGVRVESNVSPLITGNQANLIFAIDGALAEARTGAFFGNNQAPLTSRTIQFISQSTITEREIKSNPSITDPNSTLKGPGYVAPQGIGSHFPPGVQNTPQVDLFQIEGTNRDTTNHPIYDANGNIVATVPLAQRFNVNPAFVPTTFPANEQLVAPDSYGFFSGLNPNAMPRGIGTLPGGIPIVKNGQVVGGIGVFFPGTTGFASEENSSLSSAFDPKKLDRSLEAEFVAFAALGGSSLISASVGTIAGIPHLPEFDLPFGRIDLVGISLPLVGPGGPLEGPENLIKFGKILGQGVVNGVNEPLLLTNPATGRPMPGMFAPNGIQQIGPNIGANTPSGIAVPEGFLVSPHAGPSGLTASDVLTMIEQGVQQAIQTRAAIRLNLGVTTPPLDATSVMVISVADPLTGEILGLFRMPDSTIFSIDVAAAKSRNVAYYDNPAQLQQIDMTDGVPAGVAFENRTFRYLALPRFPEGIDGTPPGQFSILNDGGVDFSNGNQVGAPLPANAFKSVLGHDAFFPQTNFRDPFNPLNQNGIVFFPGSSPLYKTSALVGGLGVSGDGVDQDDVVTNAAVQSFGVDSTSNAVSADHVFTRGIRLPFMKFNRQPLEGT